MPMLRYAYARSVRSHVQDWDRVRVASGQPRLDRNLTDQASKILKQDFNPANWLISHATIVASVDTVDAPNARLGAATVDGKKVLRKTTSFRIKTECDQFINSNFDSWSRDVLLKSYKTFVGAHNFCFAPGTEIMMADGSMRAIQDVVVGDSVITHKGRAQLVTHVFERDYAGDAQALYFDKFKTPVIATGNHPFRSIQVTAPPLNAYRKSGAQNQARYRGDQIVRFLRGDANVFESKSLCDRARKVVSASDVPLTSGQIQKYLGAQQANLDAVFRENPLVFESRVMLPSEHPELKGRNRTSRVWSVRKDAPPISEVSASDTWTPASDLEPNTYVLGPNCEVGSVHCPEKARLLGYYLAEGCRLNPTKHTGVVITFGSHEQNLATDAADLAASVFPGCKVVITPTLNNTLQVKICSPEVSQWMTENAGTYSHGKRVTEEVFSWDKASLTSLLSGWMAGDGSVSSNTSRLRGATTSQVLAHQMRRVAELCGIKSSVIFSRLKIGDVSGQVRMNHADGSVSVHDVIPRHHLWELVVSQGSVQAVADQSVRWSENLMGSGGRKRDDFAWWSGCRVHKVARNQTVPYYGKVYNLEVGDDHSYVINHGIAVHNCEHVQIENLSKGRILDAVARDIGDSVYVDILIATDRKHRELIKEIESGELSTLSMGCSIDGSTCTKCGHWAADESEFCECVRYFKGNTFYDERDIQHKIAELCGDVSMDPTGGVNFIEASWVKVPAFKGAVARNLITLSSDDNSKTAQRLQKMVGTTAPQVPTSGYLKAARDIRVGDEGTEEAPAAAPPSADPLKDLTDEVRKFVIDSVKKSLKEDLTKAKLSPALLPSSDSPNDTVVKQARSKKARYLAEMRGCVRTATCDRELVQKIARLNRKFAVFVPEILYRTALKIGSSQKHASLLSFLGKCEESLGRAPSMGEARTLVRFAKLLSIRSVGVKPKP